MFGQARLRSRPRTTPVALLLGSAGVLFVSCTFPDYRFSDCTNAPCQSAGGGNGGVSAVAGTSGAGAVGGVTPVPSEGGIAGSEPSVGGEGLAGTPGVAPEPGELDGVYEIVVEHSAKCLDPNGAQTLAGHVTLQQLTCDGSSAQVFTLKSTPQGSYTIAIDASSDCVDIEGSAPDNETAIVRSPCDGRESQNWRPLRQGDGSYLIVNAASSKCFDIKAGSQDNGLSVQEYTCNARNNQRWFLSSRIPTPLPVIVDEFFSVDTWSNNGAATFSLTPSMSGDSDDCNGARAPGGRGTCYVVSLVSFPSGSDHVGASWMRTLAPWGSFPGLLIAPGAARVHFQARGEKGGEGVTFRAGGVSGHTFNDEVKTDLFVILTSSWQGYSLDLSSQSYAGGVLTGFVFTAQLSTNNAPLKFYVDDLVWE